MTDIRGGSPEDELNTLLFQALILWPRRIRERLSSLTFKDAQRLDFNVHLHRNFNYRGEGEQSWTDLDFWLREILATHRTLFGWYSLLFERSGVRIDWIDGGPLVPISTVTEWTRLVSRFDPDVLLTFDWARRKIGGEGQFEARSLPAWATAARASDAELRGLWRRGLSDMHIHVGGVRLPHETWLDLLLRCRRSAQFDTLRKSYEAEDCDLEQNIEAAIELRRCLVARLGAHPRYELQRVRDLTGRSLLGGDLIPATAEARDHGAMVALDARRLVGAQQIEIATAIHLGRPGRPRGRALESRRPRLSRVSRRR